MRRKLILWEGWGKQGADFDAPVGPTPVSMSFATKLLARGFMWYIKS